MAARPAARWLRTLASPVRTAGVAGAALLLGAGGALAATGTDVALVSPTAQDTVTAEELADADAPVSSATDDATDDAATDDAAALDTTEQDDPATVVSCEDAANHGEYVSSVAHATPPGPGHGVAVREAAHSDCGKADTTNDDATADDAVSDDAVTQDSRREKTAEQDRHRGNGKADVRGQGQRR